MKYRCPHGEYVENDKTCEAKHALKSPPVPLDKEPLDLRPPTGGGMSSGIMGSESHWLTPYEPPRDDRARERDRGRQ